MEQDGLQPGSRNSLRRWGARAAAAAGRAELRRAGRPEGEQGVDEEPGAGGGGHVHVRPDSVESPQSDDGNITTHQTSGGWRCDAKLSFTSSLTSFLNS